MRSLLVCGAAFLLAAVPIPAQAPAAPANSEPHFARATRLMQERNLAEAAREFEQAVAADPKNDVVRIQYGVCLFAQELDDQARRQFETARQHLGDLPGLTYYLGRLDLRANDTASAIRRLQPLETNPAFPKAAFYLGLAYLAAGQQGLALEKLERAARNNPHDPEVHYRLGRVYSMAGRNDDASREYRLYRENTGSLETIEQDRRACADALRSQPLAQARAICGRIADPKDARRSLLLGQLYGSAGAFADAVEPLQQAVRLEPDSFDGWQALGASFFFLERYREAVEPLRKAAALNPQYFASLSMLGVALFRLGDATAALPVLERAHNLNPTDANTNAALEQARAARKGTP